MQAIAHAYGYDQLWKKNWQGQDMTINLLEFGPLVQKDYQTFAQCTHSQTKITTVDVDGAPDPTNPNDAASAGEATLDVEMVQALAPQATIVDYQSGFGDNAFWWHFNDELRQIIKDNEKNPPAGSVISISYGGPEGFLTDNDRTAIDESLKILTQAEHMTIFVASGDCAAFDTERYNTLAVDYPGVSPWVVDVGGTKLTVDNNFNRSSEVAWSDGSDQTKCTNHWGSGGGNSTIYPRPEWQKADGIDNKYSNNHRQIPDISAIAFGLPVFFTCTSTSLNLGNYLLQRTSYFSSQASLKLGSA
jgi:kumamolisin